MPNEIAVFKSTESAIADLSSQYNRFADKPKFKQICGEITKFLQGVGE